jgi:rhamnosyltransferase
MVFDLKAYDAIGAFSEDYFIDLVDIEWCLRARHKGFELLVTPRAMLRQSIGRQTKRLLGRAVFVHAPARNFTLIRNSIWMARFAPMSFGRRVNEWGHLVMRIAHLLLAGHQRRDRACQILRGIRAGMRSKPRQ